VRLSLVIPSLAAGGAERVLAVLANEWADAGHGVTLVTVGSRADDRQPLHPAIDRVALDMLRGSATAAQAVGNNWVRVSRLRDEIRRSRPDAVISFLSSTNVLTLAATRGLAIPVIVAERIDPSAEPISPFWSGTRRLLYPRADALVVQTAEAGEWAARFLPAEKIHVIPNPAAASRADGDTLDSGGARYAWLEAPGPKVFAAGRLTPQKGFDLLLRAFALCRARHPHWSLIIVGEGEERARLQALAAELHIEAAVALPGYVPNAPRLFPRGDLFVLSSRYEGFPNALLDAMTSGLPVIAADCPSGPRRIIRDGVDGLLVRPESVESLHAAMDQLMDLPDLRQLLGSRAVEVRERFSVPRVMKQWNTLLDLCMARAQAGSREHAWRFR